MTQINADFPNIGSGLVRFGLGGVRSQFAPRSGWVRGRSRWVRVEFDLSSGWVRGGLSFCSRDLSRFFDIGSGYLPEFFTPEYAELSRSTRNRLKAELHAFYRGSHG